MRVNRDKFVLKYLSLLPLPENGIRLLSVLSTLVPVFLILALGFVVARYRYLPDEIADALNAYALKVGVPVLLFMAMYRLDFSKAFHPGMLVSFYAGAFFCFFAAMIMGRLVWKRRPGESVAVGFCAFFSNTVLLGVPISQRAFGDEVSAPVFGVIALHASLLYATGMSAMEIARRDGRNFADTASAAIHSIAANPLMIGILSGLAVNYSGLRFPEPVEASMQMIAATAIPVSLVGIGIALNRYSIKSELSESLMVSALALLVHPSIAFVLSHWVFDLPVIYVQAAVVLAAMPPGMNIFVFASLYNRAVGLSASVIVIANIISIATIALWLVILQRL